MIFVLKTQNGLFSYLDADFIVVELKSQNIQSSLNVRNFTFYMTLYQKYWKYKKLKTLKNGPSSHQFITQRMLLCKLTGTVKYQHIKYITEYKYTTDSTFYVLNLGKELEKFDNLEKSHSNEWLKLWTSGRIELQGNLKCSQAAASSLYNILNSIPIQKVNPSSSEETDSTESYTTLFTGLSPSGLPWGDEEVR